MKYIKNQFAKVVFLFLVISLIVTGMLKLADHDFIYSLSILFGCSSPAPLTLKICFFMLVILAQYFNADGFIKNIDYLLIRYGSKYQTLRSLLKWVFFSNMVLVFTAFVGAVVALYFCTGSLSGSFSMDSIAILTRGFFHCVILAAHPRWRDKMLWSNSVACSRLYFFETVVFTIGFICIFI